MNQANLRSINVVQAGERSRVVLNLWQPASYKTEIQGSSLKVTLLSAGAAASPTQARTPASAKVAPAGGEPITLNFFNADIEAVARTMKFIPALSSAVLESPLGRSLCHVHITGNIE